VEEIVILFLGVAGFSFYLIKEKQFYFQLKAKRQIQREASLASKDLTDTYSYIGEINRKMDILKDIALGLNEGPALTEDKEMEMYRSIVSAVQMFTKTKNVSLRFINVESGKIIKEIRISRKAKCEYSNPIMTKENKTFLETDEIFFIRAPKPINKITACIAIEKRGKHQKIEDLELIQALAAQALFLFNFSSANRTI